MTNPERIKSLIGGASNRVGGVQATLREMLRPALLEDAFRTFVSDVEVAAGGGYLAAPLGGAVAGADSDEHEWHIRLWADQTRFRQERTGPDMNAVLVVAGDKWWEWSPGSGLHTEQSDPGVRYSGGLDLLDGALIAHYFDLEPSGDTVIADRAAIRIRATRREVVHRATLHVDP